MSTSVPKISVNSAVGAKIEATTGVAEAITATECGFVVRDAKLTPDESFVRRMLATGQGNTTGSPGLKKGTFTCKIECVNGADAGSSPAYATTFFPACNLTETAGVWTPHATDKTLTIVLFEDGKKKQLAGARGSMKLTVEHGQIPVWDVTFQGIYSELTDASVPTIDYGADLPDVDNHAITIGSFTPVLSKFEFDQGNDVQMRENLNSASGYLSACIVNRDPSVSMDPEEVAQATFNADATFLAATEQALSLAVGTGSGKVVTVAADQAQIKARPGDIRNNYLIRNLQFSLNEVAGSDPSPAYSITFS